VENKAREEASRRGWNFDRVAGDMVLIRRLLNGDWNEDYLLLRPGEKLGMSYDAGIIRAEIVDRE
jgi:hypothetical protein